MRVTPTSPRARTRLLHLRHRWTFESRSDGRPMRRCVQCGKVALSQLPGGRAKFVEGWRTDVF